MEKHDEIIQQGDLSQHRSQGVVERFNRTLADRLFSYQYDKELEVPSKSNREWVSRLQNETYSCHKTDFSKTRSFTKKNDEEKLISVCTKVRCFMNQVN